MLEGGGVLGREANVRQAAEIRSSPRRRPTLPRRPRRRPAERHRPSAGHLRSPLRGRPSRSRRRLRSGAGRLVPPTRARSPAEYCIGGCLWLVSQLPSLLLPTVMLRRVVDPRIPEELFTARLLLRRWRLSDLDALAEVFARREVWEFPLAGASPETRPKRGCAAISRHGSATALASTPSRFEARARSWVTWASKL